LNIWSCEFVARHFSRYDKAAEIPAMRIGFIVAQVKIAPESRILITPVSTAVRKAIRRPLKRSFQSSVRNFDFIENTFMELRQHKDIKQLYRSHSIIQ
jgi:hypothetical protein